jgi:CDP-glycerol glycerophosphotransferase
MFSRLRGRRTTRPRLSVVVPVYNVENYLAECLDSIRAQTFTDLEVVLVDDGSTDGSSAIAEQYAGRHANISMIRQANAGLAAARNSGVRHVSGELLAFVDSDDTIPPHAYELMVSTLDESGSDFVVGSVVKGPSGAESEPPWLNRIHRQRRIGINVEQFPEVIHDVFAWNKVFRREFWDRAGIRFPEGLRYEDQVAITRAYLLAERIDVVRRPVYRWRVRDDRTSITQGRQELADLRDRLATKRMASGIVDELAGPGARQAWYRHGLPGDLPQYFRHLPDCSDDYWRMLSAGLTELATLDDIRQWQMRAPARVTGWLVATGERAAAAEVMAYVREHGQDYPVQVRGDHVVGQLPFVDDDAIGLPPELFWLSDRELEFEARLLSVERLDHGLAIRGWALIRGAPTAESSTAFEAWLADGDGNQVSLEVEEWSDPQATAWVRREHQNYDRSGFTATVDLAAWAEIAAPRTPTENAERQPWTLVLRRRVARIVREGTFRSADPAALPVRVHARDGVEARFDPGRGGLRLRLREMTKS